MPTGEETGMEAELLELAREAVAALQLQAEAAGRTRWVEVAQLFISGLGLLAILVGLMRMKESGVRRDREIDELAAAFRQQGEAMTQALAQQSQALERQGQALERMTQGLAQQGQALERMTQGLERQGRALEEVLRRTASPTGQSEAS